MSLPRLLAAGLLCGALTLVPTMGAPQAARAADVCFVQTGHCVGEPFLTYWQTHGGLAMHGYPLYAAVFEQLEDGKSYMVQYFERSRFEQEEGSVGDADRALHTHDQVVWDHPLDRPVKMRNRPKVISADGAHAEQLPIHEFDAIFLGEDASFEEAIEFLHGEQVAFCSDDHASLLAHADGCMPPEV